MIKFKAILFYHDSILCDLCLFEFYDSFKKKIIYIYYRTTQW